MDRRDFLATGAGLALAGANPVVRGGSVHECHPTYATPLDAMKAPRERLLYVPAIYVGTGRKKPDYLATVDIDPSSEHFGKVIHRLSMPNVGDELHHFGWNACSSCHGSTEHQRRYLIVPGLASNRIHIIDTMKPKAPSMHKVIDGAEVVRKTGLTTPHTVHCLADGHIMLSMLGDARGNGPGGFILLNDKFQVVGRWEKNAAGMKFNYDFWYQPRHNVMISSEWAAPNTVRPGFRIEDVQAGKYGQQLHFWDWKERSIAQTVNLGENGLIPLEVRFHHNPDSSHGFVGAALSSAIWHWYKDGSSWKADRVIQVKPIEADGWPFPVPGLITDLVLSLDDRFLYFSNWLQGDIRQYDVSNPAKPKLTGQLWLGGVLGKGISLGDEKLVGGPQMLQLSRDGKRLYVTSSLYSSWDNQFYPDMAKRGSFLLQLDCDTIRGGLSLNRDFHVDFGKEPDGPARAHEIRFPTGDSTSDIWV